MKPFKDIAHAKYVCSSRRRFCPLTAVSLFNKGMRLAKYIVFFEGIGVANHVNISF
jgi:hypothetical protein